MQASIRWFGWVRSSWCSTWPSRGRSRLDLTEHNEPQNISARIELNFAEDDQGVVRLTFRHGGIEIKAIRK